MANSEAQKARLDSIIDKMRSIDHVKLRGSNSVVKSRTPLVTRISNDDDSWVSWVPMIVQVTLEWDEYKPSIIWTGSPTINHDAATSEAMEAMRANGWLWP